MVKLFTHVQLLQRPKAVPGKFYSVAVTVKPGFQPYTCNARNVNFYASIMHATMLKVLCAVADPDEFRKQLKAHFFTAKK